MPFCGLKYLSAFHFITYLFLSFNPFYFFILFFLAYFLSYFFLVLYPTSFFFHVTGNKEIGDYRFVHSLTGLFTLHIIFLQKAENTTDTCSSSLTFANIHTQLFSMLCHDVWINNWLLDRNRSSTQIKI